MNGIIGFHMLGFVYVHGLVSYCLRDRYVCVFRMNDAMLYA